MRLLPLLLIGPILTTSIALAQPSGTPPTPAQRSAAATLGDLSPYKVIAADALSLIRQGDLAAARKRGTDLETAWDKAEGSMKPKDPVRWRVVDKAIDKVLAQLRAPAPETAGCATTLTDLIGAIDRGGAA